MMNDGIFTMTALLGSIANGPSNCGDRNDGKICVAQAGECRYNYRYYTQGMRDAKSWSQPFADESCPDGCCYLREEPRNMGSEKERRERVGKIIGAISDRQERDRIVGQVGLMMMGVDPRGVDER